MYLGIAQVRYLPAKIHKNHQTPASEVQKLLKLVSNGGVFVKIWMKWG